MKIVIHISGGNLAGVYADDSNLSYELFDEDNLKAEGLTDCQIDQKFKAAIKNLKEI